MACATIPMTVAAAGPTVQLPSGSVTIHADYGTQYWFDIAVSGVPLGQDIANGNYHGWCVQKDMKMSDTDHSVILKSSYDFANLSPGFQAIGQENWNKINYIINNRGATSRNNTQMAIWHLTDDVDLTNYTDSQALIDAANQYGADFTPTIGQKLAVPLNPWVQYIQLAFLELVIPGFEGLVWKDTNKNGLQNSNEPGLGGVQVQLYDSDGNVTQTSTTNAQGKYLFENVQPGTYYLKFTVLSGYQFTTRDAGSDDTIDSDADSTGKTIDFTVTIAGETITKWDAGMYVPDSEVTPTPPEDEPTTNIPPTADLSTGEPYKGFINSSITFDGSASYDPDGRIISYRWNFGDGVNGTGAIVTHIYTTPGDYTVTLTVSDNKFVERTDTSIAHITSGNNKPNTPSITGSQTGHATISYQYAVAGTDPDGDTINYTINWGDDIQETSPVVASGQSFQFTHQWTSPGFYQVSAFSIDTYGDHSDTTRITVAVDVKYVGSNGYLIDQNGDGTFDQFHNNATGVEVGAKRQQDGKYLIDTNGDGTYDLQYDPAAGTTQPYSEQPLMMYLILVLAILIIVALFVFYLLRKRRRPQQ